MKIDPDVGVASVGCAGVVTVVTAGASSGATGPGVAAGAAIVVALLTAWTTNRRLDRQLTEERARLVLQLEASAAQERLRLDHERHLEDLRLLRDMVEQGLASLTALEEALRGSGTGGRGRPPETIAERRDAVFQLMHRFNTRLSSDDPIYVAFQSTFAILNDIERAQQDGAVEHLGPLHERYLSAYRELAVASRKRTISKA